MFLYTGRFIKIEILYKTRCTRVVSVVFPVTRMQSSNSARMNISDFTREKIV